MSVNMTTYIDRHRKPGNMCRVRLNIHSKCRLRASKSSRTDSESVDFLKQLILKLTHIARWSFPIQIPCKSLLCKKRTLLKGTPYADTDNHRRTCVRSRILDRCEYRILNTLYSISRL